MNASAKTEEAPPAKEAKKKHLLIDASLAARDLMERLRPECVRCEWTGSVRRKKHLVSDFELLIIPKISECPEERVDFFEPRMVNWTERRIDQLVREGILAQRPNVKGQIAWGPKIKLGLHVKSGIPVDLFMTTEDCWWNYLVCRTGPKASNERIAVAAQAKGWKWKPYTAGFCKIADDSETDEIHAVTSEREVFEFVGLPYHEPWERK